MAEQGGIRRQCAGVQQRPWDRSERRRRNEKHAAGGREEIGGEHREWRGSLLYSLRVAAAVHSPL